jgi:glycolate oxidase FAD binding subunit
MAAITDSQVVASAVEVDLPSDGPTAVAVLLEGTEHGVAGRAATAGELLGGATAAREAPGWFGTYPFDADGIGLKLTSRISAVSRLLVAIRHAARRHDVPIDVRGSASGVLYAGLPGSTDPGRVAAAVEDLRAAARTCAGSVVVLTAPEPVREVLDMWGPVPGLDLMRRLKDQLDPEHRLSPGRYVGGI